MPPSKSRVEADREFTLELFNDSPPSKSRVEADKKFLLDLMNYQTHSRESTHHEQGKDHPGARNRSPRGNRGASRSHDYSLSRPAGSYRPPPQRHSSDEDRSSQRPIPPATYERRRQSPKSGRLTSRLPPEQKRTHNEDVNSRQIPKQASRLSSGQYSLRDSSPTLTLPSTSPAPSLPRSEDENMAIDDVSEAELKLELRLMDLKQRVLELEKEQLEIQQRQIDYEIRLERMKRTQQQQGRPRFEETTMSATDIRARAKR